MEEIKKNQDQLSEEQLDQVSGGTRIDPNTIDPDADKTGGDEDYQDDNKPPQEDGDPFQDDFGGDKKG